MTNLEAQKIFRVLVTAFPKAVPADTVNETAATYRAMLAPLDFELAQRAVQTALRGSKFFPSIAELHEAYDAQRDAVTREREIRESRQLTAGAVPQSERHELAVMARGVVESLGESLKLEAKRPPVQWRNTLASDDRRRTVLASTEPCGQCDCCKKGKYCARILALSPEDEKQARKLLGVLGLAPQQVDVSDDEYWYRRAESES